MVQNAENTSSRLQGWEDDGGGEVERLGRSYVWPQFTTDRWTTVVQGTLLYPKFHPTDDFPMPEDPIIPCQIDITIYAQQSVCKCQHWRKFTSMHDSLNLGRHALRSQEGKGRGLGEGMHAVDASSGVRIFCKTFRKMFKWVLKLSHAVSVKSKAQ